MSQVPTPSFRSANSQGSTLSHTSTAYTSLHDDHTWTRGDFILVSEDGRRFRIDAHYLLSASSVFRDMIGACNGERQITFVDPLLEDADVISRFLNLIVNVELDVWAYDDATNREILLNLFGFLSKWGCDSHRKMALTLLRSREYQARLSAVTVFVIGAVNDDVPTCCAAMQDRNPELRAYRGSSAPATVSDALDPRQISWAAWKRIPHRYLWALLQCFDGFTDDAPKQFVQCLRRTSDL